MKRACAGCEMTDEMGVGFVWGFFPDFAELDVYKNEKRKKKRDTKRSNHDFQNAPFIQSFHFHNRIMGKLYTPFTQKFTTMLYRDLDSFRATQLKVSTHQQCCKYHDHTKPCT